MWYTLVYLCSSFLCRAKGFQHQRMTNGAMNVEIGNPAYKIYEGEPDDDAGELLDADFTLDPDKVERNTRHASIHTVTSYTLSDFVLFFYLCSRLTSQTQYTPLCTWELTTAATLWPAQMRRRSCYHVEMRSLSWIRWRRPTIGLDHAIPNTPIVLPFKEKWNKKNLTKSVKENW